MNKSLKSDLLLLFVTLGWGLSYLFVDISLTQMEAFTLNAFRFLVAFAAAGLLSFKHLIHASKETWIYSISLGLVLVLVYIGATFGVMYTTLSNTGFLASLTVIFAPILTFIYYRRVPNKKTLFAIVLCFTGIALLTIGDGFSINRQTLKGDLYSILCALAYAHHLLLTEKAVRNKNVNPYQVSVFQLLFCGIFNLIIALVIETPNLPSTVGVWAAALFLAIICSGLAFIVQTHAQRHTTATRVALIFSLEPVFAGIAAYFFAGEVLSARAYIGATLMIISILIVEIRLPNKAINLRDN